MEPRTYVYQPSVVGDDFDRAADALAARLPNRVVRAWPSVTAQDAEAVREELWRRGVRVVDLDAERAAYSEFARRAAYDVHHPDHHAHESYPEKSFEHHLACKALDLSREDVFLDVASSASPLPEIAARVFGCRSFAQDIMYAPGLSGDRIGGDACAMPVAAGFATKAALTCSLEHFEGDADTRLFRELSRVVSTGGRVLVVPLYLTTEHAVMTDPLWSTAADVRFDADAVVYCAKGWGNRHGRFYSPRTLVERILAPSAEAFRFTVLRIVRGEAIHPSIYARFALVAERV
jgi:hypothetical protein